MKDFWGFLLQTLTVSGVAVLVLLVKAMFRDKLPPRWHLAVWGLLAAAMLLPAGRGGRYVLVNWPWAVETLRTLCTGRCDTLTAVRAPIPLPPSHPPQSAGDWLFLLYTAGVVFLLARYLVSYLRLRMALRRSAAADAALQRRMEEVAARYQLPRCRAVAVPGLRTALICGVVRPVLVLPGEDTVDDKVLLHELLHLKHHDVLWGLLICFFRCLHWCNPLLWHCANLAGNDLESCCDQRVLELLSGEERRKYGHILLSMANERYARAPGTSSMANGGKNIRRRIEAIARFRRYPKGMGMVSLCVLAVLAALLPGSRAGGVYQGGGTQVMALPAAMASARTTWCTTYAGAMDTYARAVLEGNGLYRAMCAPLSQQPALMESLRRAKAASAWPPDTGWDASLPLRLNTAAGYAIYNLRPLPDGAYEGLLVLEAAEKAEGKCILCCQLLRAEQAEGRWVILPQEPFQTVPTSWSQLPYYSCDDLPAWHYEGDVGDFTIRLRYQTVHQMEHTSAASAAFGEMTGTAAATTALRPDADFSVISEGSSLSAIYRGAEEDKRHISAIGISVLPAEEGEPAGTHRHPGSGTSGGSSSTGAQWGNQALPEHWEDEIWLAGGGGSGSAEDFSLPEGYSAALYLNGSLAGETRLSLTEGGALHE